MDDAEKLHTPRRSDEYDALENFQRSPLDIVEIQALIQKQSHLPWYAAYPIQRNAMTA